jgi:hypothetical protein
MAKKPTKHSTKFFIVVFLIQGFIEIIAKRLPQNTAKKRNADSIIT